MVYSVPSRSARYWQDITVFSPVHNWKGRPVCIPGEKIILPEKGLPLPWPFESFFRYFYKSFSIFSFIFSHGYELQSKQRGVIPSALRDSRSEEHTSEL